MPDVMQIKEKIISLIKLKGPSLPVQIAGETGLSILFASAFLSELYGEKIVNISNIRVGSSPLYFIPGQEPQLERFSQYLKSKEKDAFIRLKENKFLKDSEQEPAIRIALREIKDFAIPFKKGEEIYWRFFIIPEEEFEEEKAIEESKEEVKKIENIFEEPVKIKEEKEEEPIQEEKIIEKTEEKEIKKENKKKPKHEEHKKQNKNKKKEENFFNKIKEFLSKEGIEILDIEDFKNDEAVLKVKRKKEEELFFVFNKKKITEKEILETHKKASDKKMKYNILFFGEPSKKLSDLISAIKNLSDIIKID
ncbi:hypothetical protein M0R19_00490 [Candidatus Pacearchaeota archaeon]|jgi:hypothetical protein|nr:hypothetical protein [Candidatus Pacearchaeota archaeon]